MSEEVIRFIGAPIGIQMVDGVWTLRIECPPQEGAKIAALGLYCETTFEFTASPVRNDSGRARKL